MKRQLIGLAIVIFIIMGGLFWILQRVRLVDDLTTSMRNLKEISADLNRYCDSYSGKFPSSFGELFIFDTSVDPKIFVVPWGSATPSAISTTSDAFNAGRHCSYYYLAAGLNKAIVEQDYIVAFVDDGSQPLGGVGCLFADGHVEILNKQDALRRVADSLKKSNTRS